MNPRALTSIIIPIYNVEGCLSDCVKSVIAQTNKDIEIILVNDGSTDNSGGICDNYAKKFDNILVIHKTNEGVNYARRDGFIKSRGEYITFVDADDILDSSFVNNHLELIKRTSADCTICKTHSFYGGSLSRKEIDQCSIRGSSADYMVWTDKKTILSAFMTSLPPCRNMAMMSVWGKLYRRKIFEKINWEIANYSHGEDYFISVQVFNIVDSVCFVNENGYFYRKNRVGKITQSTQHNTAPDGKIINNLIHIQLLAKMYKEVADGGSFNLSKEIVIFQCRLYVYWLDKLIDKNELSVAIWDNYIKKYLFSLIPTIKTTLFREYMYKNLYYGGELYESLCNKLDPIYKNPDIEQYLQYKISMAKILGDSQQNYVNYDNAWVVMDRQDSATDNGYYFYNWIRKNHPEIKIFFVINIDSMEVPILKSEGFNLVYTNTEQHRQLLDNCSVEIYAFYTFNSCSARTSFDSLKVYLGHGIHKGNSLNPGLGVNDLFVTTLKREFDYFNKNHDDFKTILTGMPRFEHLTKETDQAKDKIVIAPTWRRWLRKKTGQNTNYFTQWSSFIESEEIKTLSKKYEIVLMIHPEMKDVMGLFKIPKYIRTLRYEDLGAKNIQHLIKSTRLMVTDYSSVSFDYAIAGSELAYFQFDQDEFYDSHTTQRGWYDYEKDGFGPVFYSSKELNKYVITKNFSEESSANMYKERLNNLLRGHSGVLKHPSENIYSRIIKSMGKRRRL